MREQYVIHLGDLNLSREENEKKSRADQLTSRILSDMGFTISEQTMPYTGWKVDLRELTAWHVSTVTSEDERITLERLEELVEEKKTRFTSKRIGI